MFVAASRRLSAVNILQNVFDVRQEEEIQLCRFLIFFSFYRAHWFLMTTHARGSWNSYLLRQDWCDEDILAIHLSCVEKKHCKWQWHTKQSFVNVGEKAGGYLSRDLASVLRKLFLEIQCVLKLIFLYLFPNNQVNFQLQMNEFTRKLS